MTADNEGDGGEVGNALDLSETVDFVKWVSGFERAKQSWRVTHCPGLSP